MAKSTVTCEPTDCQRCHRISSLLLYLVTSLLHCVHFVTWHDSTWLGNPVSKRTRVKEPRRAITSFLIITSCWATLTVANTINNCSEEHLVASVGVTEDSWWVGPWQLFCNCLAVAGRRFKQTLNYEPPLQMSSPLEHHNYLPRTMSQNTWQCVGLCANRETAYRCAALWRSAGQVYRDTV